MKSDSNLSRNCQKLSCGQANAKSEGMRKSSSESDSLSYMQELADLEDHFSSVTLLEIDA